MITVKYHGFDNLPESYSAIFKYGGEKSYFLTKLWFDNFITNVVSQDEKILIYGVELNGPGNEAIAALPLKLNRKRMWVFSPRSISSLTNYYSCYFEPIISPDANNIREILSCLAASLWKDRDNWDSINLNPLPVTHNLFPLLIQAFSDHGMLVHSYFCFGNWYLNVAGRSYSEYFAGLSSILRKNIPYMLRKIKNSHRMRIEVYSAESDLDLPLAAYEKLYLVRWNRAEPFPNFIRGLAIQSAKNGSLRLGLLSIDDEPAAAQIWLVNQGIASIYKTAFDQRFSNLSVGTILTAHLMQHVIDVDKVMEVDYLSGDDTYKKFWMTNRRERWGIQVFNPKSVKGIMLAIRHIGGRQLKDLLF